MTEPNPRTAFDHLAQIFHERYEELAPHYGWKTQEQSAVPWDQLPENQKDLMVHVVARTLEDPRTKQFLISEWFDKVEISAMGLLDVTYLRSNNQVPFELWDGRKNSAFVLKDIESKGEQ